MPSGDREARPNSGDDTLTPVEHQQAEYSGQDRREVPAPEHESAVDLLVDPNWKDTSANTQLDEQYARPCELSDVALKARLEKAQEGTPRFLLQG